MGHTFQLFHTFDIKLCTNTSFLINLPEVKKKEDEMPKDYILFTFLFLDYLLS
jgi:hypothetical protein